MFVGGLVSRHAFEDRVAGEDGGAPGGIVPLTSITVFPVCHSKMALSRVWLCSQHDSWLVIGDLVGRDGQFSSAYTGRVSMIV